MEKIVICTTAFYLVTLTSQLLIQTMGLPLGIVGSSIALYVVPKTIPLLLELDKVEKEKNEP